MWEISVVDVDGKGSMATTHGRVDGKQQTAVELITEGKNVGRSNETTPVEQAVAEATARWTKQKKRGYVEDISQAAAGDHGLACTVAPMLAKTPQQAEIVYPCFVQPKLDGHRCLANGVLGLWSRNRRAIVSVPHIGAAVAALVTHGVLGAKAWLDGELYIHDHGFQGLTSLLRRSEPGEGHERVEYHIYDMFDPARPNDSYSLRKRNLDAIGLFLVNKLTGNGLAPLRIVSTAIATSPEQLNDRQALYLQDGYEGLMSRDPKAPYVQRRSAGLIKVKTFQEQEFMCVGVEEGRGALAGKCGALVLETLAGVEFRAKPVGSHEFLADILSNPGDWIGEDITVKFMRYTDDGVPFHPVALRKREDV